jgi:hypothetical protein
MVREIASSPSPGLRTARNDSSRSCHLRAETFLRKLACALSRTIGRVILSMRGWKTPPIVIGDRVYYGWSGHSCPDRVFILLISWWNVAETFRFPVAAFCLCRVGKPRLSLLVTVFLVDSRDIPVPIGFSFH